MVLPSLSLLCQLPSGPRTLRETGSQLNPHPSSHLHLHQSYRQDKTHQEDAEPLRISVVELGFTLRPCDPNPDTSRFLPFSCPHIPVPISSSFHPIPILCCPSPKNFYSDLRQDVLCPLVSRLSRQDDPFTPYFTHARPPLCLPGRSRRAILWGLT